MIFRSFRARLILLVIILLALAACQAAPDGPQVTAGPTLAAASPTPRRVARTLAPTHTPAASPTPTQAAPLGVDPGGLRGVEIEFWHPWQGELADTAELLASEFSQSNEWGIRVRRQPFYSTGALSDQVAAGLESDPPALPDVVAAPTDQLADWAAADGIVTDLSGLIADPQVGLSAEEVSAYAPAFWDQDRQGERQIGLPLLRSARVLFYNQTWAQELGFPNPPASPADFEAQACAAAVANNGSRVLEKLGTGGWLIDTDALTLLSWLAAFGAQPLPGEPGSEEYNFDSEEGQGALAFLRGMLDDGCAWLGRSQTQYDYFAGRSALFYAGSLQDIYVQKEINRLSGSADQWTILPFPGQDGQPVVFAGGYSLALLGSPGAAQDEQARREQLAGWLFIRWLSQPRNQARLGEGLPSIPVSSAAAAQLADYKLNFPWDRIMPLGEVARPAPGLASWRTVRRLVEDAAWQIYHLPAEQVNQILPQLDDISREFLSQK